MRARRVLVVVTLLLLAAGVALLAHAVSYVPFVGLLLMVAGSRLYLERLAAALSVEAASMATTVERGTEQRLALRLASGTRLPMPRIELEFFTTDIYGEVAEVEQLVAVLGPLEVAEPAFEVRFAHLGSYRAGIRRVRVVCPLGLFVKELPLEAHQLVTVTPRQIQLPPAASLRAQASEKQSSLRPIVADDLDYTGVREYAPGDAMKQVHWKLSARTPGTLMTRLYERHVNPSLSIVVDSAAPAGSAEQLMTLFDGMVETTVALAREAHQMGIDTTVHFISAGGEERHTHLVNEEDVVSFVLSLSPLAPEANAEELLERTANALHGASNIILICAAPSAQAAQHLQRAAASRKWTQAYIACPRVQERDERASLLRPLKRTPHLLIHSNEHTTEVVGQ